MIQNKVIVERKRYDSNLDGSITVTVGDTWRDVCGSVWEVIVILHDWVFVVLRESKSLWGIGSDSIWAPVSFVNCSLVAT